MKLGKKVKIAKQYRISKPFWLTSKYADVCMNLPDDLSVNDGYHSDCYKTFTAVAMIQNKIILKNVYQETIIVSKI